MSASVANSVPNRLVVRALFRTLLRLGKQFDRNPSAKLVLYRKPATGGPTSIPKEAPVELYYNNILNQIYGPESLAYFLAPGKARESKLDRIIRNEFRKESDEHFSINERVDFAFTILKKYSSIYNSYSLALNESISRADRTDKDESFKSLNSNESSVPHKYRKSSYQVKIVDDSVDSDSMLSEAELAIKQTMKDLPVYNAETIEPGVLLLAHPMVHGEGHRSVILILQHNESGSYGVVINSTTDLTLSHGVKNLPLDLVQAFGRNVLFKGGLVRRLQCIHPFPGCGGVPLKDCSRPTYFGGDIKKLISHATNHPEDAEKVKFFAGSCVWDPGSLNEEIKLGYWIPARSKPDVLLFDNHKVIYHNKGNKAGVQSKGSNTSLSNPSISEKEILALTSDHRTALPSPDHSTSDASITDNNRSQVPSPSLSTGFTGGRKKASRRYGLSPRGRSAQPQALESNSDTISSDNNSGGDPNSKTHTLYPAQYRSTQDAAFECINIELWDWAMGKLGYEECRNMPFYTNFDNIESVDVKIE